MDRMHDIDTYPPQPNAGVYRRKAPPKARLLGFSPPHKSPYRAQQQPLFQLGKLQIAGILLIFVFIWGVISAVAIAMSEIDPPALTEFEDDGKGDVHGFVTDEEGQILDNVTVFILGTHHFTNTNEEGFYSIKNVKEGDYEIEASLEGYGSVTKRVSIKSHIPALVRFTLEEGGHEKTEIEQFGSSLSELKFLNRATSIFIIVYGLIALVGGIFAYLQRFYLFAMIGGLGGIISGVLSIGIIIAPILSVIALLLIVTNQEEFRTLEPSLAERFRGLFGAEARARAMPKVGTQRYKAPGKAAKPKFGAPKPRYYEEAPVPRPMPMPLGEMERRESMPPRTESVAKPAMTCTACKGTIKSEAHGVICQCGASYHRFCANSVSVCRKCGAQL